MEGNDRESKDVQNEEKSPPLKTVASSLENKDGGHKEASTQPLLKPESPNSATPATTVKCAKCGKRVARRGCTQLACFTCCDDTACATHLEVREQAQWRERVLAGTTPLQRRAGELRGKAIPSGRFKETGFSYLGDSVVLWDVQQYLSNPAWRDDAVRKSKKRKTRQRNHDAGGTTVATNTAANGKRGRRQRFADTMERLYQQSLSS